MISPKSVTCLWTTPNIITYGLLKKETTPIPLRSLIMQFLFQDPYRFELIRFLNYPVVFISYSMIHLVRYVPFTRFLSPHSTTTSIPPSYLPSSNFHDILIMNCTINSFRQLVLMLNMYKEPCVHYSPMVSPILYIAPIMILQWIKLAGEKSVMISNQAIQWVTQEHLNSPIGK